MLTLRLKKLNVTAQDSHAMTALLVSSASSGVFSEMWPLTAPVPI